jgi:N-acetylglucosaminyl-diphospho-decaprenol L-rhamnosyltransferase
MHVAVAIVGYRNSDDIERCLAALQASVHDDFEVVICENGGPTAYGRLKDVVPTQLPGGQAVRILLAPGNLGYAGGVNACLRAAPEADAWWVLNPDTVPHEAAMQALAERIARGDCDAAGGVIHGPDGMVESYGGRWTAWFANTRSIGYGSALEEAVDPLAVERRLSYLSGASMMISRRFLEAVGPLREDYFLYCEEVEWFLRGAERGMRLGFAPEAKVLHHQGATTGSVLDFRRRPRMPVYLDTRNKILTTRDHFPARIAVASTAVLAIMTLRCAKNLAWRQWGYVISGWMAGLRNERGPPAWLTEASSGA